jgi:hypothetical protein
MAQETVPQREILGRYRHLRAISTRHHSATLDCLARSAMLEQAKHLGLAWGQILCPESEAEMTLLFDLAIHTAKPGRSRAIDRYAKSVSLQSGSDEALTLEAMRRARFSVWRIERQHETAGAIVTDLLRDSETWLVDEGLALSAELGMTLASRLCWPADFAMTCGVIVPIDAELMEEALFDSAVWLRHTDPNQLADDPRFATATRIALRAD